MTATGFTTLVSSDTASLLQDSMIVTAGADGALAPFAQEQVEQTIRKGNDLLVVLVDGREVLVEGYFLGEGVKDAQLPWTQGDGDVSSVSDAFSQGEMHDLEVMALGRIDAMFGAEQVDFEIAAVFAADEPVGEASSPAGEGIGVGTLALGGVAVLGAVALLSSGGDDGGGGSRSAAALSRIIDDPENEVTAEDWAAIGVERDLSANDLANLATVIEAHSMSEEDDLTGAQARWLAEMVLEAAPEGAKDSYSVVSAAFDEVILNIDSGGGSTPDLTVKFETRDRDYRPESAAFDDGTSSNGTDEQRRFVYSGSNKVATEYDGWGSETADGTIERVGVDHDTDGTVNSWYNIDDDGTTRAIESIDYENGSPEARALAKVNSGTATASDYLMLGMEFVDTSEISISPESEAFRSMVGAARASVGTDLTAHQIWAIAFMIYTSGVESLLWSVDEQSGNVYWISHSQVGPPSECEGFSVLDSEDYISVHIDWNFDRFAAESVVTRVMGAGLSSAEPSVGMPGTANVLQEYLTVATDYSNLLRLDGISLALHTTSSRMDWRSDGVFDLEDRLEVKGVGPYYDVVTTSTLLVGGNYSASGRFNNDLDTVFLGEIPSGLDRLVLHEDPTSLIFARDDFETLFCEMDGERHSVFIDGDTNDSIDMTAVPDALIPVPRNVGDDGVSAGTSYRAYDFTDRESHVTFLVDAEISVVT